MTRTFALVCVLAGAPFQCASDPNTTTHNDIDSAPEALWNLAERFGEEGNLDARRTALEELRDQYPSSRFAVRAKRALAGHAP